jgi:hypothetical protein
VNNLAKPTSQLAVEVKFRYQHEFLHAFPYKDCRKLHNRYQQLTDGLIPSLDLYFSFIAGFSSSATTLGQRSQEEIRKAIPKLTMTFFETYPAFEPLKEFINPTETASLYHDLSIADDLRQKLVRIMVHLASAEGR